MTVQTIQNTWELLTGQKISGATSDVGSLRSSVSDQEFGGMDLVQTLRLMTTSLEDQLGILSQQVNSYYQKVRVDLWASQCFY